MLAPSTGAGGCRWSVAALFSTPALANDRGGRGGGRGGDDFDGLQRDMQQHQQDMQRESDRSQEQWHSNDQSNHWQQQQQSDWNHSSNQGSDQQPSSSQIDHGGSDNGQDHSWSPGGGEHSSGGNGGGWGNNNGNGDGEHASGNGNGQGNTNEHGDNGGDGKGNGDGGHGSDHSDNSDNSGNGQNKDDDSILANPPQTVERLIKKLTNPKPQKASGRSDGRKSGHAWTVGDYPEFDPRTLPRPGVLALGLSKNAVASARAKGFKVETAVPLSGFGVPVTRVTPPPNMSLEGGAAWLRQLEPSSVIGVNQKYHIYKAATGNPDGTEATQQGPGSGAPCEGDHCFGREIIGWRSELRTCARKVPVGIIDTRADISHPAFKNKKIEVKKVAPASKSEGEVWHGTGILALLAGDPNTGTPGLIPDASFYLADVFFGDEKGLPTSDTMSLVEALSWLETKKVKIINMSLSGPPDDVLKAAIVRMAASGVIFVAAAGNNGPGTPPSYPAAYPPVIAVTAVDKNMKGYRYANQGDYIDVAAPGVAVWTALPGGKGGYHSGTSFAVPYVTSAMATMYDRLPDKSKPAILKQMTILDLGAPGTDDIYGRGLLMAPDQCNPGGIAQAPQSAADKAPMMRSGAATPASLPWSATVDEAP